ncbi:MAG: NADH:flavin oxidoreductase [Hyphomicrobiales bacterium]|nr:NADH:flavin oxidoreductase [Hyphomicrobiales bacterium]
MSVSVLSPLKMRNLEVKNRIFRSNISGRFDNEDGSLTQTRVNWERMFAEGGAGAIISSYVPVLMSGRIIAGYATIHDDSFIPLWAKVVEAVHAHGCKYVMQLSHGGRQIDLPGLQNQYRAGLSSTNVSESLHGFPSKAMSPAEIDHMIAAFANAAWRAREAGIDGVELHAANGYLFTQFLSSGINDRTDKYGGGLFNRARFLLDVIQAIRVKVGPSYHLQVKISAIDYNNVIPTEGAGNSLDEMIQIAKWSQNAGVDALHVSVGSLFPHPLNPPGDFSFNTIATTYDAMLASGTQTLRNYMLFRFALLRPIFRWLWFRMKAGRPIEGVSADEAYAIKQAVSIPVISTGGWQTRSTIDRYLSEGYFDGVSIARSLIANPDLPMQWAAGADSPAVPCTYCNKCLLNAPKNPLGCYDETRFGGDRNRMIDAIMRIYDVKPELKVHSLNEWRGAA